MLKKRLLTLLCLVLVSIPLSAQGVDETSAASRYDSYAGKTSMEPAIVASTSWVGAIVEAAGASNVLVLAPIELRHPPEYDFSPQDIMTASRADLVFWAGYEGFIGKLVSAAQIPDKNVVQVQTNNAPDQLASSVESVAKLLGNEEAFTSWKRSLDDLSSRLLDGAQRQQTSSTRAVVQFHQQAFARYAGYDVVAVFGPQDLSLGDVTAIEALDPDIIIDNWHSPQGEPFKSLGRTYVQLINFPGPFMTRSILDVLTYNATQLQLIH